ncbi:MAG: metal-dependent transcriptional regulator [Elusimicrobiota bacterium]
MSKFKKFALPTPVQEEHEEALSLIWLHREKGSDSLERIRESLDQSIREGMLDRLVSEGLVRLDADKVLLTDKGDREAAGIIRRSRLAERILTDVLTLSEDQMEASACRLEHILSDGLADAICTLLGHPEACPHGKSIPHGRCCEEAREEVGAVLQPLERMAEGECGRVAYLTFPDKPDTQRLLSMGVVPGAELRVEQCSPAFVVAVGENTVAMEASVARGVFVRI